MQWKHIFHPGQRSPSAASIGWCAALAGITVSMRVIHIAGDREGYAPYAVAFLRALPLCMAEEDVDPGAGPRPTPCVEKR